MTSGVPQRTRLCRRECRFGDHDIKCFTASLKRCPSEWFLDIAICARNVSIRTLRWTCRRRQIGTGEAQKRFNDAGQLSLTRQECVSMLKVRRVEIAFQYKTAFPIEDDSMSFQLSLPPCHRIPGFRCEFLGVTFRERPRSCGATMARQ